VRAKPDRKTDALGEVGWYLQRERVRRQEALADIATTLGLHPIHLAALEHGDFEYLPKGAQVFEVLARYADYLGYEPEPLVAHYEGVLRARSPHLRPPSNKGETVVWFGDYKQKARNFAHLATGPGVLGVVIAVMIGLISFYTLGPIDSGLQRQAATQGDVKPEGRNIITSTVPKQVPGSRQAIKRISPPLQDLQGAVKVAPPSAIQSAVQPSVQSSLRQAAVPEPPKLDVPDVQIRLKPLTDNGAEVAALPKMARDRLTALIDRDIRDAVQSAPKRIASAARGNQTSSISPQTGVATATGKKGLSTFATNSVYGSMAKDVRVVLKAKEQVWVRVEDNKGNIIFTQTLGVGDSYRVPNQRGLMLDARNAGALDYTVDGLARGAVGSPGEIVIGLPLDVSKLATRKN
jgi:cytoskeletal protein RodZ